MTRYLRGFVLKYTKSMTKVSGHHSGCSFFIVFLDGSPCADLFFYRCYFLPRMARKALEEVHTVVRLSGRIWLVLPQAPLSWHGRRWRCSFVCS